MNEQNFQIDLMSILNKIIKNLKFIFLFTLVALILGVIAYFLISSSYKTKTTFILRNPLEYERNQSFSQDFFQNKQFFANEDNIDEIFAIAKSGEIRYHIKQEFNLDSIWPQKAESILMKRLEVKRNDTREIDIEFYCDDKNLSAAITNFARKVIERKYQDYFTKFAETNIAYLSKQIDNINIDIARLDDSIANVRSQYGIYDQLLPTRGEVIHTAKSSVSEQASKGLEILQPLVIAKDKLVKDIAQCSSVINQHKGMIEADQGIGNFFVLQEAHPDTYEDVPNVKMFLAIIAFVAIIISTLIVVIRK